MGEHRPEVVAHRLLASHRADTARIAELERRMANWDDVLGELQLVVGAAAEVKSRHFAEAADALVPVIDELKAHLGLTDDPRPDNPEQPAI